jgi:hypothetical protein
LAAIHRSDEEKRRETGTHTKVNPLPCVEFLTHAAITNIAVPRIST